METGKEEFVTEEVVVDKPQDVKTEETSNQTEMKKEKKELKNKYKETIAQLEKEVEDLKNQLLLNRAELENFKKRMREEQIKDRKYASMGLVGELITPVEYLLKASSMTMEDSNMNNFLIGFKMLGNQILEALKNDGLEEIEALNKEFDPSVHHALSKEYQEGVAPNTVIEEIAKGYKYKDRVLKPSMVKVSEEKIEEGEY